MLEVTPNLSVGISRISKESPRNHNDDQSIAKTTLPTYNDGDLSPACTNQLAIPEPFLRNPSLLSYPG
jgi:hypothetical protein